MFITINYLLDFSSFPANVWQCVCCRWQPPHGGKFLVQSGPGMVMQEVFLCQTRGTLVTERPTEAKVRSPPPTDKISSIIVHDPPTAAALFLFRRESRRNYGRAGYKLSSEINGRRASLRPKPRTFLSWCPGGAKSICTQHISVADICHWRHYSSVLSSITDNCVCARARVCVREHVRPLISRGLSVKSICGAFIVNLIIIYGTFIVNMFVIASMQCWSKGNCMEQYP